MLRIGLCDDNADARLLLQDALERTLEINGWEAQFFQFSSGEGLLMLAVDNPIAGAVHPDLRTTKADPHAHGHGLPGMRSIAARYGGSLETRVDDAGFHLLVCLSPGSSAQTSTI